MMQTHVRPETPVQDALLPLCAGRRTCQKAGRARREHEIPQTVICSSRISTNHSVLGRPGPLAAACQACAAVSCRCHDSLAWIWIHATPHRILPFRPDRGSSSAPWRGHRRGRGVLLFGCQSHDLTCLGDGRPGRPRWVRVAYGECCFGRVSSRAESFLIPQLGRICADVPLL